MERLPPPPCPLLPLTAPQVLPVEGQNDGAVDDLLITGDQFESYVSRHRAALSAAGALESVPLVAEGNGAMRGTYCMLDARGRFYSNGRGAHEYGPSLLDVGAPAAWAAVRGQVRARGRRRRARMADAQPASEQIEPRA